MTASPVLAFKVKENIEGDMVSDLSFVLRTNK
jgi:hypothetical protein